MEPEVKIGYYDVMILYTETDRKDADIFREHLVNDIILKSGDKVKAVLYDCEDMRSLAGYPEVIRSLAGSRLKHVKYALERSTYVFVYLTKKFLDDIWMECTSEECLMTAIYDEKKRWRVVPVHTKKRGVFRIPMVLDSLKGISYYNNDEFYRNGVSCLIGDKVYVRKRAEENHLMKQKKWVEDFKKKQLEEEEERKINLEVVTMEFRRLGFESCSEPGKRTEGMSAFRRDYNGLEMFGSGLSHVGMFRQRKTPGMLVNWLHSPYHQQQNLLAHQMHQPIPNLPTYDQNAHVHGQQTVYNTGVTQPQALLHTSEYPPEQHQIGPAPSSLTNQPGGLPEFDQMYPSEGSTDSQGGDNSMLTTDQTHLSSNIAASSSSVTSSTGSFSHPESTDRKPTS